MKSWLGILALGLLLATPSVAQAVCPVLDPIGDKTVTEGELLTFTATATDADAGETLTFSLINLIPAGAAIDPNTGEFTWTPTSNQGPGGYDVTVQVTDNATEPCAVSEIIHVTVNDAGGENQCPVLAAIGDKTVTEGQLLTFTATATDADGDPLTFSLINLIPAGAAIDPNTGVFTWTPTPDQGPGASDVTIQVSDNAATPCMDSEIIHVTVLDAGGENQCPVLTPIGNQTVTELSLLTFTAVATDPDAGQTLTFSLDPGFPTGAAIDPSTGVFTWTPTVDQGPGDHTVVVRVTDDADPTCSDFETITITVNDAGGENACPVLAAIGDKTVTEGQLLTFTATATDADGDPLTFSLINLIPAGAAIDPNTGVFTWTPTSDQGPGGSNVTIQVSDNAATPCVDSEIIFVTVLDAGGENIPPVVDAPDTQTVDEGQLLTFTVSATDADGDTVQLTVDDPPFGSTFVDHGNNTGTFTWTPSSDQSGNYTITFRGDDGNGGIDTDVTTVTVNDVDGGGDFETEAEMMGRYNSHRKYVCFRIHSDDSFDLRDVELGSLELVFGGSTLNAVGKQTHIGFDCDECFECEDGDDDCDDEDCEDAHIRVCFLNTSLRSFFDGDVLDGLGDSEIHGSLENGQTFTASLGGKHLSNPPGNGNDQGEDHADRGKKSLKLQVRPNPLNPKAEISFTLTQAGQVRIALYDLRGRLVKMIVNENRAAGDHVVSWDGSGESNRVASGVYFLKIQAAAQGEDMKRVTVLK
jgi:hypothetical protein